MGVGSWPPRRVAHLTHLAHLANLAHLAHLAELAPGPLLPAPSSGGRRFVGISLFFYSVNFAILAGHLPKRTPPRYSADELAPAYVGGSACHKAPTVKRQPQSANRNGPTAKCRKAPHIARQRAPARAPPERPRARHSPPAQPPEPNRQNPTARGHPPDLITRLPHAVVRGTSPLRREVRRAARPDGWARRPHPRRSHRVALLRLGLRREPPHPRVPHPTRDADRRFLRRD